MGKRDSFMIKADEFAAGLMNVKQSIQYMLKANKKIYQKNSELKIGEGESDICFVLGNGPSLKNVDLSLIESYPSITVNFFHKGVPNFASKYHLFLDPYFGETALDYVLDFKKNHPKTKLIMRDSIQAKLKAANLENENNYYIYPNLIPGKKVKVDLQKAMDGSLNVVPVAIECALYMGYKKIYLLGCDFNSYASRKEEHFYDGKEGGFAKRAHDATGDLIRCALVHKQHYALEEYSRVVGTKIVNLTENSLIDAYEFGSLSDILK